MLQTQGCVHLHHRRLLWPPFQVYLCLWSRLLAFHFLPGRLPFHRRRAPLRLRVSIHRLVCIRVSMYRLVCLRVSDQVRFHQAMLAPAMYHKMFRQMYRSSALPRMCHHAILAQPTCHQAILATTTTKQAVRRQSRLHLPRFLVKPVRQASRRSLQMRTTPGSQQQIHIQDRPAKDVHHS